MPQVKLRGSVLLKVVSIIMIIFGAINVASGALSAGSGRTLVNMFGIDESAIQYFRMLGAITLVTGAVMLVFGILGVRLCNRADKVGFLLVLGIIQVVITAFSTLYNYVMAPMGVRIIEQVAEATREMYGTSMYNVDVGGMAQNVPMMAVGFVLPVLFIVGALLNKLPPKAVYAPYMQPVTQSGTIYEQSYTAQDPVSNTASDPNVAAQASQNDSPYEQAAPTQGQESDSPYKQDN